MQVCIGVRGRATIILDAETFRSAVTDNVSVVVVVVTVVVAVVVVVFVVVVVAVVIAVTAILKPNPIPLLIVFSFILTSFHAILDVPVLVIEFMVTIGSPVPNKR